MASDSLKAGKEKPVDVVVVGGGWLLDNNDSENNGDN